MLKLLKYDMLHSWRSFGLFYLAFLFLCLFIPFTNQGLIQDIAVISMTLIVMFILFGTVIMLIRNYNSSMFKRPGYLTLTLPHSTLSLLLSKILTALIWITLSGVVLCFGILLIGLAESLRSGVFFWETIDWIDLFTGVDWGFFFKFLFWIVVLTLTSIVRIYACCTLVQTRYVSKHKGLAAFLIFFVICVFSSIFGSWLERTILTGIHPHWDYLFNINLVMNYSFVTSLLTLVFWGAVIWAVLEYKLEIE